MSELFRLVKEEFLKEFKEWQWTYLIQFEFTFNKRKINKITITDHVWKKKGRKMITKELILNIFKEKLNRERREPTKKHGQREVFVEEKFPTEIKIIC